MKVKKQFLSKKFKNVSRFTFHVSRRDGFTLIEILVSITIFTGLMALVALFSRDIVDFGIFYSDSLVIEQEIQQTAKLMTGEIRSMESSGFGSYPITQAHAEGITFYTNMDSDELIEQVRYFLDGHMLKRGVIKPGGNPLTYNPADERITEMIHDIVLSGTPVFQYYDKDYAGENPPLVTPLDVSDIRVVQFSVTVDRNANAEPGPVSLTVFVNIRNLRFIL